jgi:hypothetical protein
MTRDLPGLCSMNVHQSQGFIPVAFFAAAEGIHD